MLRDKEWREENSLILRNKKVYVLKNKKLKAEVIQLYYDTLVGEYGEQQKTIELVTKNFWWLGVTKEVKKYIESYDICQRNKNHTKAPVGKLISNIVLEKSQSYITVDFITKLLLA